MHYQFLFSIRSFIRIGMAEFVERPEVTRAACRFAVRIVHYFHVLILRPACGRKGLPVTAPMRAPPLRC